MHVILSPGRAMGLLLSAYLVSAAFADPPCFRELGLEPYGGAEVTVTGMSADGIHVVGHYHDVNGGWHWVMGEGPQPGGPGGRGASYGISADGRSIVGTKEYHAPSEFHPFRWTAGVGAMWLTALDMVASGSARAVSADGLVIAGGFSTVDGVRRAFRWDPIGGVRSLGALPGGAESRAYGVSADGSIIVGWSTYDGASSRQAFRWTEEDGMVGLGFLPDGGLNSEAYAVSAEGETVVGSCYGSTGSEAFRWTESEGMVGLGLLPGAEHSTAFAASADGSVIVGTSWTEGPFVWDADHGMRSIPAVLENDYGLDLSEWVSFRAAGAVSADGTIVAGEGRRASANPPYYQWDAWIARLVPVTGTCPGDLDYDGDIDLGDLALLLASYEIDAGGDLNCDNMTGLSDLSLLLGVYGTTCD